MAINFPSSPSNNQLFVTEGKAMRYNSTKNRWKAVSTLSSSQITDLEARTVGVSAMSISGNTLVIQKDDSSYANVSLASFAGNKLTTYANASILPLSDLVSGTQVYVEDTDSLYITDGSGWYKIATVNLSPSLTLGVSSISLGSGGSVDVNYTVNEPEDTPYTVTASSTSNATITVHQANNTITFDTPVASSTETITITATDGINSVGDTLTMTISLGPDWSSPSLVQTLQHPTGLASAWFGSSVDFDGTTLVVGAYVETVGGVSTVGVVRTYTLSGGSWTLQQTINSPSSQNDAFGTHVSVSGNTLAIAIPGLDNGSGSLYQSGGIYIYTYNGSTWSQQTYITSNDHTSYEQFGNAGVKLIGDELLVANPYNGGDNVLKGAAYFFTRSGSTWTQSQKIVSRSRYNNERFAGSVDFDGELMAISSAGNGTSPTYPGGYVDVYTRSGTGSWSYSNTLLASEGTVSGDQFGTDVAVEDNGNYVMVGAQGGSSGGVTNGAVYVFTGSGNTWTQQAKLLASDSSVDFKFGNQVKFTGANAEVAVVGSFYANVSSNTISRAGSAYTFTRSGNTWTEETRLQSANAQTNGFFSRDMAIANNILIISARQEDTGSNTNSGSVYVYEA